MDPPLPRLPGPRVHRALRRGFLSLALLAGALAASPASDPWIWLEEVNGKKPLEWVAERNAESVQELTQAPGFRDMEARFLEVLDSEARIPYVEKIGSRYYNFWKDKTHERGVWRRATLAEYRRDRPAWETVLDLDSLAKAENENWVWHGAEALPPDHTRALVSLSRGGADADVVREFDLTTGRFVAHGFTVPEAKTDAYWKDRDDVYLATDFGPGSMTTSGYPRIVKEWRRGTPMSHATVVFEGKPEDVYVLAWRDHTPGFERDFVMRGLTFFSSELFVRRAGGLVKIEKPDDADAEAHREWLLVRLRTEWTTGGKTWPAGSLLATRFEEFLKGGREFHALFRPTPRKSLAAYSATKNAILVNELDNVRNKVYVLRHEGGAWTRTPLAGLPEFGTIKATAVDARESDDYWLTIADFLTPSRLQLGSLAGVALAARNGAAGGAGSAQTLKQTPEFFDARGLAVTQHEAISRDGTRVPYFQVGPAAAKADGSTPTLLYGYGGFELSEVPVYSGLRGRGWLERGAFLVVANIRGGGEFGPPWHQAAMKGRRGRAYEDFIAVGEDLVRRKVTSPRHLACIGGSNGGLLVGNMLTMRPDLFRAVVCQVPLLDMLRYHKLLAGASWMDEYGNPDVPAEAAFLGRYSPYHNVEKGVKYPRTLFTTSTRDDRVHPGHARKMVAKMKDQGHDVLYYENVEGGHGGAATNKQTAFMWALAYTFLANELK